jgi:hypothetical protein
VPRSERVTWHVVGPPNHHNGPLSWLLYTDERVFNTAVVAVGAAAVAMAFDGGPMEVLHNLEGLGVLGGGIWGAAFVLRKSGE